MSKFGWIALYRQIENHWLWEDKPFSKGQAWIDLLLLAHHNESKFLLGNDLIELKQGSFVTSELKLMTRWGWGKSKTRAFLDLLQKDGMIIRQSDHHKTIINIVNYGKFSNFETVYKPPTDHNQTTVRPQSDTTNNDNNYNNNILYIGNAELKKVFDDFVECRKQAKKPLNNKQINALIRQLDKLGKSDSEKIEIVNQSIINGWKSFYPLKKEKLSGPQDYAAYDLDKFEQSLNKD